jgi:anti-sigma-K factor RskA
MSATDVHSLAGPYVLHALDRRERDRFARHLTRCGCCAAEVAELSEAVVRLADVTWAVPPPHLRSQLLNHARRTRQQPPLITQRRAWRLPSWPRLPRQVAFAVAAGLSVLFGVSSAVLAGRLDTARGEVVSAQARAGAVEGMLAAPGVLIRHSPVTGGGQLSVVTAPGRAEALLVFAADHAAPSGRVYQLWLIDGGQATSMGTLDPGQRISTHTLTGLKPGLIAGVTVEPTGGSPTPTLPIAAQATIT